MVVVSLTRIKHLRMCSGSKFQDGDKFRFRLLELEVLEEHLHSFILMLLNYSKLRIYLSTGYKN